MTLTVLVALGIVNVLGILMAINRLHLISKEATFLSKSVDRLTPQVLEDFFKYIESVQPLLRFSYEWLVTFKQKIVLLSKGNEKSSAIYRSLESFPQILSQSTVVRRTMMVPITLIFLNVSVGVTQFVAYRMQYTPAIDASFLIQYLLIGGLFSAIQLFFINITNYRLKHSFKPCFAKIQQFCPLFDTKISQLATLEISRIHLDYLEKIVEKIEYSNSLLQDISSKLAKKPKNSVQGSFLPTIPQTIFDIGILPERPRVHVGRTNKNEISNSNQFSTNEQNSTAHLVTTESKESHD